MGGDKSKNINNHYLLINDLVQQGDLEIHHKSTGEMSADYKSNPIQGTLFFRQKAQLLNIPLDYNDDVERRRTHPDLLPKNEATTLGGMI